MSIMPPFRLPSIARVRPVPDGPPFRPRHVLVVFAVGLMLVLCGHGPAAASEVQGTAIPPPHERPADWPVFPYEGGMDEYDDPLEGINRVFFYFNGALDFLIAEPAARVYRFFTPAPARTALGRAFTNLAEPTVSANHLLQGETERAGTSLARFLINITVGVAGLFDVASDFGLEGNDADFGQTLHSYGVGDGIYLVLPVFGPTTIRDAVGLGVDGLMDPRTYLLKGDVQTGLYAAEGIVRREEAIEPVDFLREHADEHYVAVRAWTYQQRRRELEDE